MTIKKLLLLTNKFEEQKIFYKKVLGFDLKFDNGSEFTVDIGLTELMFKESEADYKYHYCFLIPSNKLNESIDWLKEKVDLIKIEEERIIQKYEDWNASSIYFYDASGNLAEFIVRYNLKNEIEKNFDSTSIISVNEIGLPSKDNITINTKLVEINSFFWKGDLGRFGANGDENGLFLLVNNELKENWFPTDLKTQSSPFKAEIEVENKNFEIVFDNENIELYKRQIQSSPD